MSEVPTVEIHSPKDAFQKWIINYDDYKPGEHRLWGEHDPSIGIDSGRSEFGQSNLDHTTTNVVDERDWIDSVSGIGNTSIPDEPDWIDSSGRRLAPSAVPVSDFVSDSEGNVVSVMIVNPEDRRARKELPISVYDPDQHILWSARGNR